MYGYLQSTLLCLSVLVLVDPSIQQTEDDIVRDFFERPGGYNERVEELANRYSLAAWDYNTNITKENQEKMTELSLEWSEFAKNESMKAKVFNLTALTDPSLKRQIESVLDVGISGYEDTEVLREISELTANMTSIYSSAQVCGTELGLGCLALEPGLTDFITNNRSYDYLAIAWKAWRDVSGAKMKTQYAKFVELMNKAIKAGGVYSDMGDYYRSWYEDPDFENDVRQLFEDLRPLYDNLHAYVRKMLREFYGADKFPPEGHIPAHLFGNMWAQQWSNIYELLEPYPAQGIPSLTSEMENQNYTVVKMFEVAEEFFQSLGMSPMPESFWRLSMLEKPADGRPVVCHASAWDFSNGTDFRIKQCTTVTQESFLTVHHEMGHVEYFIEYKNQSYLFRAGANPGFHEGVADIVSLSFQTPEHLKKIGLLKELPTGMEGDINFLLNMALDKVAFLPFGYLIDQWRWSVYRGDTTPDSYNRDWWNLRCKYQGISPPVPRSENDFDPGAKYHVPGNTPYIRYFVSFVLQFQWHQALCNISGHNGSLHRCDIYQNTAAGQRLQQMLQMGSSQHWGEALFTLTQGTSAESRKMSAQPLLDYFQPLQEWLVEQNANENVGWDTENCPKGSFVEGFSSGKQISFSYLLIVLLVSIACIPRNVFFN